MLGYQLGWIDPDPKQIGRDHEKLSECVIQVGLDVQWMWEQGTRKRV